MKKAKYLILVILIIFLILPRPAFAFIGTGIFDYFEAALEGIEEFAAPIIKWITQFLFIYLISLFTLFTSGSLLQYIINQQGSLGFSDPTSMGYNFVQAGWQITSSLANMALLLIFLAIAFAWILKIESFVAQKALIKLILAALLVNFSLLFVGVLVDISNVFYNAFLDMGGGSSIVSESINRVFGGLWGTLSSIITLLVSRAILSMVVFTAPFVQLAFVVTFSLILLPQIVFWIFQVLIGFFLSSIFLLYFLLFAFRMFVIWILAVLSPLAFVCLVLPQTKKYWDEWLKNLLEWVLMGIFALFFLILGLKTIGFVAPAPAAIPFASYGAIPGWFVYYFFMFIYFCVALWLIKKATPQIASFIMDQGKAWGSRAVGLGMPYLRAIRQQGQGLAAESEFVQNVGKGMATWTGPRSRFGKVAAETFMVPQAWRAAGRAIGSGAIEAEQRSFDEAEKKNTGKLYNQKVSALISEKSRTRRAGIISAISEDGEMEKLLRDNNVKNVLTDPEKKLIASKAGQVDRAKKVVPALLPKGTKEEQEKWLEDIGVHPPEQWEKDAFKIETRLDKVVGRVKPANIKYFSSEALEGEGAQEAIHEFWHGAHISQAALEFGKVFLNKFQEEANIRGIEWYQDNNPRMVGYFGSSPARALGLEVPPSLERWEPPPGWTPPPDWKPKSPPPGWKRGTPAPSGWTITRISIPTTPSPRPRPITPGLATTEAILERLKQEEKIQKADFKELRNASDQEKEIARAKLEDLREEIKKLKKEVEEAEKT